MARNKYGKNKDGLFETSKTYDGKRVKFRGKTCAVIDQKIREYEEGRTKGRKFEVVADEWLDYREPKISESTYCTYKIALKHIKGRFQGRYIRQITPLEVDRYITNVEDKGYARKTVVIHLTVLKQIFQYAVSKTGDMDTNPAREIVPAKGLPEKKRSALTEEQEQAVETFRGDHWLLGVMLLYTGCRRGELLALNWQDIDRKAGVIHINKKLNYTEKNYPTLDDFLKNGRERDIPLFPVLAGLMPKNRIGLIFPGKNGFMAAGEFRKIWTDYCAAVGLEGITPHCFRHSYSTICFEAGIPEKDAAAFLGDTEEIMRKVYTDLRGKHRQSSAEKVNAYLEARLAIKAKEA